MDFLRLMKRLARQRAAEIGPPADDFPSPLRSFRNALKNMAIIAEVKYAVPAQGSLGIRMSPSELAAEYESLGASAVSCLTEPVFFAGSVDHLREVRSACRLPLLMKDFIVDERQICQARAIGADAVLLISEMLLEKELARLFAFGKGLGVDCLVEVHGQDGLEKALKVGADLIGVNARDLQTLQFDRERHEKMAGHLPAGAVKVAESGISSSERLQELKGMGYDAALIGRAMVSEHTRREIFTCG